MGGASAAPMRTLPTRAVDDDAGERDGHGDEAGEVCEVLLGPESAAVVMGDRCQVHQHVEEERRDGQPQADPGQSRQPAEFAPDESEALYHQH